MNEGFRREVDVIANLEFALQLLAHKVRSGPTIERDLEVKGPVFVEGDPGALSQVWINLVDNAIQAAGPSGLVRVVAENKGDGIQVSIIDSGSGIHPKNLSRIFDPFFTTKAVGSGTGLGLWVVREIIEKHGGTIAVASNPNGGACFVVTLPQYLKTGRETVGSLH
jgi:signal transduction histidine kinase